jgi:hypothetical protein
MEGVRFWKGSSVFTARSDSDCVGVLDMAPKLAHHLRNDSMEARFVTRTSPRLVIRQMIIGRNQKNQTADGT